MELIVQNLIIYAVPILFGLTVHEFAHGLLADRLGDPTPRELGRLTLNPLSHLDLIGTVVFFVTRVFGWAKPIAINPENLKSPRRDLMWIAMAGPLANFSLALCCALIYHLLNYFVITEILAAGRLLRPLQQMLVAGVVVNISLGLINLIPIPPLDGGRILAGILPETAAGYFRKLDSYGAIILIILVLSDSIGFILFPLLSTLTNLLLYGSRS